MARFTLAEVARATGGRIVRGDPARMARGVSTDSRRVGAGELFVALKGKSFDGHDFVGRALAAGAAFAVVEADRKPRALPAGAAAVEVGDALVALGRLAAFWRGRFELPVVAITGSIGKSTTKELAAAALGLLGPVLKNQGNFNNRIGLPLTLFKLDRRHRAATLELGCDRPGEIAQLVEIARPQVGLITRVAPTHLEGLGSIEGVARAKGELIAGLGPEAVFVLNLDDPLIVQQAKGFKGRRVGFTARPETRFAGELVRLVEVDKEVVGGRPRLRFTVRLEVAGKRRGRPVELTLWTLSRHNAVNATAALAVARALGLPLEDAAKRLRGVKPLAGRGEVARTRTGVFVMDDTYNASPESVAGALETLAWWKGPRRGMAALGEMMELGGQAEFYHRQIGRKAAEAGLALLVARGEHARAMAEAAVEAGLPAAAALVARDNREATALLERRLQKGDWVLVKGSRAMGMEAITRSIMR